MNPKFSYLLIWLLTMVLVGLLAGGTASAMDLKKVMQDKDKGESQLDHGDIAGAMSTFKQLEAACGQDGFCLAVASLFIGRCLLETDRINEALDLFRKSEDAFARFNKPFEGAVAKLMIGRALTLLGQLDEALRHLESAEQVFRRNPKGQEKNLFYSSMWKVDVYLGMFQFTKAKDALKTGEKAYGFPTGKGFPEMGRPEAEANKWKADILFATQDFKAAKELGSKLLTYYERHPNPREQASVLNELGRLHHVQSQYEQALARFQDGLTRAQKGDALLPQAQILNNMGLVQMDQGAYEAALESLDASMELKRRIGNTRLEAQGMNNSALVHFFLGDYEKALEKLRQAGDLSEGKDWLDVEGPILHNLALLFKDQGMFQQARDNSVQAIELAQKAENPKDEAIFTLRLGNLYEYYGQFEQALEAYSSARDIQERVGDRFFQSNTLADIANVMLRQISPDASADEADKVFEEVAANYGKAIDIRKEIGSPTAEILCKAALVYIEKPQFLIEQPSEEQRKSDLKSAQDYIQHAADDLKSRPNKNHKFLLDYVKARYRLIDGKPRESLAGFKALNDEARASKRLKYEFLALVGMGLCHEGLKELPQAEQAFREAVTIAEDIRDTLDPEGQRTFLHGEEVLGMKHVAANEGLIRVRAQRAQVAQNKDLWEKALIASEETKARAFTDSLAKSQWSRTAKVDQELVRRLEEIDDQIRTKSRRVAKGVEGQADPKRVRELEATNAKLKSEREAVAKAIRAKDKDYYLVKFAKTVPLGEAELEPNEWALVYSVTDTAVIGFLSHGSTIVHAAYVNMNRKDIERQVRLVRKGLVDDVWKKMIAEDLRHRQVSKENAWDYDGLMAAKNIYDKVVRDFVVKVPEKERLIVVPDDWLAMLPFEMLVTNESEDSIPRGRAPKRGEVKFLGDRHPIVYYQSVTALTLARLKWKNSPEPKDKLLVMADPRVECKPDEEVKQDRREEMRRQLQQLGGVGRSRSGAGKKKALAQMGGQIQFLSRESCRDQKQQSPELPETAGLAKAVGSMFEKRDLNIYAGQKDPQAKRLPTVYEGKRVEIYSGKDANLIRFQREIQPRMEQYGRLLFATHGVFKDQGESGGPALMLSTNPPGSYNWLTNSQIAELSMNADVAALIACESGRGQQIAGEGVMSMGRTFHLAGSRTVLMSLWSTELEASTKMAQTFFSKVLDGKSKLEAFQEARQELRIAENGKYAHPIFWAPFILAGEAGSATR